MGNLLVDKAILDLIGNGQTVLFIGAGFSLEPPDSTQKNRDRGGLKRFLIEKFMATLQNSPYDLKLMSMEDIVFYLRCNGKSKAQIAEVLRGFLESSEELTRLKSFAVLRKLVTLRGDLFEAIITTNWDKGIEDSLRDISGIEVIPIANEQDCFKYVSSPLSVLKIHGDIDDPESVILSSQDFDVYEKEHPRIVERLRILFSTKYLLLLGYGAQDENFRRIYRSLHHDLRGGLRGGWLVAPTLGDREKLWLPTVDLNHVRATAQEFLSTVLSHAAMVPIGIANKAEFRTTRNSILFEVDLNLTKLAQSVKKKYKLKDVWVARLRDIKKPNKEMGLVSAIYIECRCESARTLSISTGETMEALAVTLDNTVFRHRLKVFPTIVLLAGPRAFKDPSQVAQILAARFEPGRAESISLRLPDEQYLLDLFAGKSNDFQKSIVEALREISKAQVEKAMDSDVIVSSLRPLDWFGGNNILVDRTIPIQWVTEIPPEKLATAMNNAGVVCVHQMTFLDKQGRDVMSLFSGEPVFKDFIKNISSPSVEQLKQAARSRRQKVIIAACHIKKLPSLQAAISAKICNVLILDETLAKALLK